MKQYYGYKTEVKGVETLGLIPLTTEASFQFGVYNFEHDKLIMVSKDSKQELQIVQKMNELGQGEFKKERGSNVPLVERRLIENHLNFDLGGNDLSWFITNMVENSIIASNQIENTKAAYEALLKSKPSPDQSQNDSQTEQPIPEENGSGLSTDNGQSGLSTDSTQGENKEG